MQINAPSMFSVAVIFAYGPVDEAVPGSRTARGGNHRADHREGLRAAVVAPRATAPDRRDPEEGIHPRHQAGHAARGPIRSAEEAKHVSSSCFFFHRLLNINKRTSEGLTNNSIVSRALQKLETAQQASGEALRSEVQGDGSQ